MRIFLLFVTIISAASSFAQTVNIPDVAFKATLVADAAINTNGDAEIQVSEANAFTGSVICFSDGISDLTGIEEFVNMTALYCHTNSLTTMDLSNCVALESLGCASNSLTSLDLSNNVNLIYLDASTNELTELNVANGNNSNLPNISFNARYNDDLTCIEVDDAAYSTSTWVLVDTQTTFSENCASVSIKEELQVTFEAYPNPVTDVLNLRVDQPVISIEVTDLLGKTVFATTNQAKAIDFSQFKPGVYVVRLNTSGGTATKKVIKT